MERKSLLGVKTPSMTPEPAWLGGGVCPRTRSGSVRWTRRVPALLTGSKLHVGGLGCPLTRIDIAQVLDGRAERICAGRQVWDREGAVRGGLSAESRGGRRDLPGCNDSGYGFR